uniref:cell adhesion molecule 1-like isoform X3 n=1 Tax=Monopterus albus TaxID=43700 RepID=UPI0009B445F2|nr:cell adhesion molecule 1-like isoform X3 [Monopterus albus]
MFFHFILLGVSLSFLHGFHVLSQDSCADKPVFSPSRLVVKHGDPASATCTICQPGCNFTSPGLETSVGNHVLNGSRILWTVDRMTEWDVIPMCHYEDANATQCLSKLAVTVYKPPDNVSITFAHHTGPMLEGHQYTLQCTVQNVAPVENLTVTFYKGRTQLGQTQIENNTQKKPTNVIKTLDVTVRKDDDRVQYWCRAKLELGPEGPQPPPVVTSQHITGTVYYAPQLMSVPHLEQITVKKGDPLQLNCSAVGNPRPSYTWMLPLAQPSSFSDSVLTIDSVTSVNQGQYNCTVSNSVGTITVHFNVDVQGLEQTTIRLPPTTATTTTTTTTTTTATTTRTAATPTTNVPSHSTSITLTHWFIMCFVLLFSILVGVHP